MSHTVFISHAHKDNEICDRYARQLNEWGLDVWYDRSNMEYAQVISDTIGNEIKKRTALVVLLTPNAVASKWVGLEISAYLKLWADEGGKRKIVPVLLQECELPPLLGLFKYIDATLLGEDDAMRAIARTLGVEPPAPPPPPPEPPVTTPLTKLTVTPDEAVQLLDAVTRMLLDWFEFSEEKWRTINDSQLGWKPLRGRWNGWDEIYADSWTPTTDDPLARASQAVGEAMTRRFTNAREKGSAASSVACFLRDLETLRLSIETILGEDVGHREGPLDMPRRHRPIITNPMIVDADDDWGYPAASWDESASSRDLAPRLPRARRSTGGQQPTAAPPASRAGIRTYVAPADSGIGKRRAIAVPTAPAIAVRAIPPTPAPAPAAPPKRGWRWPWQRAKR
ncbi:MAG TPA: toll/interleukin-1 receptor domain-containing protein [Ktedonobacterales bacterium]|jgi:hypothetical protein